MLTEKIFNQIANIYDRTNDIISLGTHKFVKKIAVSKLNISKSCFILDICTGTGDIVQIIKKIRPNAKVIGMDISENMLKIAKQKDPTGVYIKNDCQQLPFKDNEFDIVTASFGIRNIEDRTKVLSEIYRVLKPGGKFLHLDFGYKNIFSYIFDLIVLSSIKIFKIPTNNYKYLIDSKNEFPNPDKLVIEFEKFGFVKENVHNFLLGVISCQIMKKLKK